MNLLVGLGNPGAQYENTRHNAGFWLLDKLAKKRDFLFASKSKFKADIAVITGVIGGGVGLKLMKPQTYMNNSGSAVAAVAAFYNILPADILVAHDEVDLPAGVVKLKFGGGTAGHNGLADISRCVGGTPYWRLRLGVGKPPFGGVEQYVLQKPPTAERALIDDAIARVLAVWNDISGGNYDAAMNTLHTGNTVVMRRTASGIV